MHNVGRHVRPDVARDALHGEMFLVVVAGVLARFVACVHEGWGRIWAEVHRFGYAANLADGEDAVGDGVSPDLDAELEGEEGEKVEGCHC